MQGNQFKMESEHGRHLGSKNGVAYSTQKYAGCVLGVAPGTLHDVRNDLLYLLAATDHTENLKSGAILKKHGHIHMHTKFFT